MTARRSEDPVNRNSLGARYLLFLVVAAILALLIVVAPSKGPAPSRDVFAGAT